MKKTPPLKVPRRVPLAGLLFSAAPVSIASLLPRVAVSICAAALLLFPPAAPCDDQPITTEELARHLGVSTWRIPKAALPETYTVTIHHIKDGKLTKEYLLGKFKRRGDLLICTRWLTEAVSISVDDGVTIASAKAALSNKPVFATDNKFQGVGVPLVLCFSEPFSPAAEGGHPSIVEGSHPSELSKTASGLALV